MHICFSDLSFNQTERILSCGKNSLLLTAKESDVLSAFMNPPQSLIPREQLIYKIWGTDMDIVPGNVDNYISFLLSPTAAPPPPGRPQRQSITHLCGTGCKAYTCISSVLPEDVFFTREPPDCTSKLSMDSLVIPSKASDGIGFPGSHLGLTFFTASTNA